jgi:hypothetical protein
MHLLDGACLVSPQHFSSLCTTIALMSATMLCLPSQHTAYWIMRCLQPLPLEVPTPFVGDRWCFILRRVKVFKRQSTLHLASHGCPKGFTVGRILRIVIAFEQVHTVFAVDIICVVIIGSFYDCGQIYGFFAWICPSYRGLRH